MRPRSLLPALLLAVAVAGCDRAQTPLTPTSSPEGVGASFHHDPNAIYIYGPSTITIEGWDMWEAMGDCTDPYYWEVQYADGTGESSEGDRYFDLYVDSTTPDFTLTVGAACYDGAGMWVYHQASRSVDNQLN